MRRGRPRLLPLRVAAALLSCLAAAGVAGAQDGVTDQIGSGVLDAAQRAQLGEVAATEDPARAQVADGTDFVTVPHPEGGMEVLPLPEGVTVAASASEPAAQDGGPAEPVLADGTGSGQEPEGVLEEAVAAAPPPAAAPGAGNGSPDLVAATEPGQTPLDLLKGLWREAVASGETAEGFETWLSAELNPGPATAAPATSQAARSREVAVAWDGRTSPVAAGPGGRVVTTFGEAIPVAHCSPLKVCYIELEPGEQLTDTPSIGDAARWQFVPKIQGRAPAERVVIEIKPAQDAKDTNLVIPTDRRLYSISLVNDPDYHTPILAFRWPDSEARAAAEGIERRRAEELALEEATAAEAASRAEVMVAELARSGVPTESGASTAELLDFRFRVSGDAPFRPVRVFSDGERTYIDLHPAYRGALPAIVAGRGEGNAALNTRVSASGSRLVADRVLTDVWLQSGKQRVRIRRITN